MDVAYIACGWCGMAMQINDLLVECDASYLGANPLNSLVDACLAFYVAKDEGGEWQDVVQTATWKLEPGTLHLDMRMDKDHMVYFDITERDDDNRVLHEWHEAVPFDVFRTDVVAEGLRVLNAFGLYGYRASWMGQADFPLAQLLRLTGKLHMHCENDSLRTSLSEELQCLSSCINALGVKDGDSVEDQGLPY